MGNILITLLIFISALAVFHLFMFLCWKTRRAWRYLEYAWLFTGVLGLLGATVEVRIFLEENVIWLHQGYYDAALERTIDHTASEVKLCDRKFSSNEKLTEQFQKASQWFAEKNKLLLKYKENPASVEWNELLPGEINETVGELRQSKEFYLSDINTLKEVAENLDYHKARKELDNWAAILKCLYPGLLAVALALRITKNSAFLKYSNNWRDLSQSKSDPSQIEHELLQIKRDLSQMKRGLW